MGLKWTDEFRQDAVRIALISGLTRKQVVDDLGVWMSAPIKWITAYRDTDLVSKEDMSLAQENDRLRRNNRILEEERDTCHVTSADVARHPEIRPNYLTATTDGAGAVRAVRQTRRIMTARALERYAPQEMLPGPARDSDDALLEAAGEIGTTIFHLVGTCRMGTDRGAVLDPQLNMRGLDGLRAVDASVMPRIVPGSTASPVIMIAEKAADMIRAG